MSSRYCLEVKRLRREIRDLEGRLYDALIQPIPQVSKRRELREKIAQRQRKLEKLT